MQQLRILSTFSITQDTENAMRNSRKQKKSFEGGGNLARDRVMDKNCVKASSRRERLHDVNESKWCNAYADDASLHRLDLPYTSSAEPTCFAAF